MKLRKFEHHLHEKLRDADFAVAYVETALEDGGTDVFLYALREVAVAQGGVQEAPLGNQCGAEGLPDLDACV